MLRDYTRRSERTYTIRVSSNLCNETWCVHVLGDSVHIVSQENLLPTTHAWNLDRAPMRFVVISTTA